MDIGELHHLLFRWLHVTAAVMWIGHTWSLVFAQHAHPAKTDAWMRGWAGGTWLTGVALLIFVYYAGGALTTPSQSLWMGIGVGVAVLLLTWLLYDAVWTVLAQRPAAAALISLLLVGGIAQGLAEFMTGRAVFIHVGATLGIILVNNTNQRPLRITHNAVIAPAVLLLMISNHFPLIYGSSRPWLAAPTLVALGCALGLLLRWLSMRGRPLQAV
ncbi:MAG TPA: urate hydroxylase PuuD [Vicinamibacterales bacterium]